MRKINLIIFAAMFILMLGLAGCVEVPGGGYYGGYSYPAYSGGVYPSYGGGYPVYGYGYPGWHHHDLDHGDWGHWHGWEHRNWAAAGHPYAYGSYHGFNVAHNGFAGGHYGGIRGGVSHGRGHERH
jgi:hypothetical protein